MKPSLTHLMDQILEKIVLAHIKGSEMKKKKKYFFDQAQNFFSFSVVLRKIVPAPILAKKRQRNITNFKIEAKKISILCTFKSLE
jgi:hypothetical protein